jgi:hypothetical protein
MEGRQQPMDIKRVLIPRADEGGSLVRKLGHAVLLQWENIPPETQKLIEAQANLVELLGSTDDDAQDLKAALAEPRTWRGPTPAN